MDEDDVNLYMKPGSQVLYLGAGNDSYSTISHISDLIGEKGIIYGVEKSEIKGLVLKTMSKKRENIKPIVQDARKPYIYKNYIPNLVDCIFINISEKGKVSFSVSNIPPTKVSKNAAGKQVIAPQINILISNFLGSPCMSFLLI